MFYSFTRQAAPPLWVPKHVPEWDSLGAIWSLKQKLDYICWFHPISSLSHTGGGRKKEKENNPRTSTLVQFSHSRCHFTHLCTFASCHSWNTAVVTWRLSAELSLNLNELRIHQFVIGFTFKRFPRDLIWRNNIFLNNWGCFIYFFFFWNGLWTPSCWIRVIQENKQGFSVKTRCRSRGPTTHQVGSKDNTCFRLSLRLFSVIITLKQAAQFYFSVWTSHTQQHSNIVLQWWIAIVNKGWSVNLRCRRRMTGFGLWDGAAPAGTPCAVCKTNPLHTFSSHALSFHSYALVLLDFGDVWSFLRDLKTN